MSLFEMCLATLAQQKLVDMHKNRFEYLPVNVKNSLLSILCKRGLIKDSYVFRQLVNPRVIIMDLSECEVTDEILNSLHICTYLQKLDLSLRRRQSRSITSEGLNSLFPHLPLLKTLSVPYCAEVNDKVISTICQHCKQLIELYIPDSSISNTGLMKIGKCLKNLSAINISGSQISDTGIKSLVNGLSETLLEINIDRCPNVSSQSSVLIAKKCQNIKIFSCGSGGSEEFSTSAKQVFWRI